MNLPFLTKALLCCLCLGTPAFAQAPKKDEKKAPAPKSPADLALDDFNKVRGEAGAKDQARFQKVINSGLAYLTQNPTHGGAPGAVNNLAFYANGIDKKQAAQRTAFLSLLKLEVANQKYKEGVTDNARAALAAVEAAIADFETRDAMTRDNITALREKIDELAQAPGGGRFLPDRERSYLHILALGSNPQRAEDQAKKLLEHKEKGVKDMAREELNILEVKKEPYALKLTTLDGKEVDFEKLRGKVVALYFWSATNGNSTKNFEALQQISSAYKKKGLEIVTVSYDKEEDRDKLMKAIKDHRVTFPVYYDGKGSKNSFSPKLNVYSVPRLLVFDQKGILQTTVQGSPVGKLQADLPVNQLEGMTKRLLGLK
jgi:peroxiredoxin